MAKQGRIGRDVANLFSGKLRDARDGTPLTIGWRRGERILRRDAKSAVKGSTATIPYRVFEDGMLAHFRKKPPHDLKTPLIALDSASREEVYARCMALSRGERWDDEKEEAAQEMKAMREQLRNALQERLSIVYVLVVPRVRGWRLCVAVQVCFKDNRRLSFLILRLPGREGVFPGVLEIEDLVGPTVAENLKLGKGEDAAMLEDILIDKLASLPHSLPTFASLN